MYIYIYNIYIYIYIYDFAVHTGTHAHTGVLHQLCMYLRLQRFVLERMHMRTCVDMPVCSLSSGLVCRCTRASVSGYVKQARASKCRKGRGSAGVFS